MTITSSMAILLGALAIIFIIFPIIAHFIKENKKHKQIGQLMEEIDGEGFRTNAKVVSIENLIEDHAVGGHSLFFWTLQYTVEGETYTISKNTLEDREDFHIKGGFTTEYLYRKDAIVPIIVHPTDRELIQIDRWKLEEMVKKDRGL